MSSLLNPQSSASNSRDYEGIAGKVWFHPPLDELTEEQQENLKQMKTYAKATWEPATEPHAP